MTSMAAAERLRQHRFSPYSVAAAAAAAAASTRPAKAASPLAASASAFRNILPRRKTSADSASPPPPSSSPKTAARLSADVSLKTATADDKTAAGDGEDADGDNGGGQTTEAKKIGASDISSMEKLVNGLNGSGSSPGSKFGISHEIST